MSIEFLISMCEKRLVHLDSLRTSAIALGDLAQVDKIDLEISETQSTLNSLKSL